MKSRLADASLWLVGLVVFFVIGVLLEDHVGIPFDTTYRVACAGIALSFMVWISTQYRGELWPWIAVGIAAAVTLSLFFMPIVNRPMSKGDVLIFGLPDAIIFFTARTVTYRVTNDHERAIRQQLIFGLLLAIGFASILLFLSLLPPSNPRHS